MRQFRIVAIAIALAGCNDRTPLVAYRHPSDAFAAAFSLLQLFGVYPCRTVREKNGIELLESSPVDECYKLLPAQRYKGIWLDQYEGSTFYQNAGAAQNVLVQYGRELAEVKRQIAERKRPISTRPHELLYWNGAVEKSVPLGIPRRSRLIALDFIGRRTAYEGRYGAGFSTSVIVVDKVIAARVLYQSSAAYLDYDVRVQRAEKASAHAPQ